MSGLREFARDIAGNWKKFDSFVWYRDDEVENPEDWAIVYTHNRDSRLLGESNAQYMTKKMKRHVRSGDVVFESHSHWACGHVDGFSMRVFNKDGKVTWAAIEWFKITCRLEEYAILDETDYGIREFEATFENVMEASRGIKDEYILPEDWASQVYDWLSESVEYSGELENTDDQGGYPSEESVRAAFEELFEQEGSYV